jgi:hypothetical protein
MDGDELVIGYLAGEKIEEPLDESLVADLDSINALLADPTTWDEPGDDVRERVLAAIASEAAATSATAATSLVTPPAEPKTSARRLKAVDGTTGPRRRWTSWIGPGLVGAAAAGLIAFAVAQTNDNGTQQAVDGTISLSGTELLPDVSGEAKVTEKQSGVWIQFDVPGLPRRDGNDFYQAWLRSADGEGLVPIGSFHDGDHVSMWAGVSIENFPILTVTRESVAGPKSPDQASSGEVVVRGQYVET